MLGSKYFSLVTVLQVGFLLNLVIKNLPLPLFLFMFVCVGVCMCVSGMEYFLQCFLHNVKKMQNFIFIVETIDRFDMRNQNLDIFFSSSTKI